MIRTAIVSIKDLGKSRILDRTPGCAPRSKSRAAPRPSGAPCLPRAACLGAAAAAALPHCAGARAARPDPFPVAGAAALPTRPVLALDRKAPAPWETRRDRAKSPRPSSTTSAPTTGACGTPPMTIPVQCARWRDIWPPLDGAVLPALRGADGDNARIIRFGEGLQCTDKQISGGSDRDGYWGARAIFGLSPACFSLAGRRATSTATSPGHLRPVAGMLQLGRAACNVNGYVTGPSSACRRHASYLP